MPTDETGRSHDRDGAATRSRMEALIAAMRRPAAASTPAVATDDDRIAAAAWKAMHVHVAAGDETIDVPSADAWPAELAEVEAWLGAHTL